jgi:transposase InsO family protein
MNRVRDCCHAAQGEERRDERRGDVWQARQRQREQQLRVQLAGLCDWAVAEGYRRLHLAALLAMSPRTLRDWRQRAVLETRASPLGRPVIHSSYVERNAVIALLDEVGPRIGLPALRDCFPQMQRAELADLLRRYRRVWRKRYHESLQVLTWLVPGAVWAMDFAEAPRPIDGLYPYLLAVRDLASGQQLLWLPLRTATAIETLIALEPLFLRHGPPLVLKTDNGSPFIAGAAMDFLARFAVEPLFSPPRWPQYNGSAEAGVGSMKTRTEQEASRHGRPTQWSWDDPAAAHAQANATARPHGESGPTPDQAWRARRSIAAAERERFRTAVAQHREEIRSQGGWPDAGELQSWQARAIDRQAIARALVEHGYLVYRRRRIPLPFPKRKAANIP